MRKGEKLSFGTREMLPGYQMFVGDRIVNKTNRTFGFSKNYWQRGENHHKSSEYEVGPTYILLLKNRVASSALQ